MVKYDYRCENCGELTNNQYTIVGSSPNGKKAIEIIQDYYTHIPLCIKCHLNGTVKPEPKLYECVVGYEYGNKFTIQVISNTEKEARKFIKNNLPDFPIISIDFKLNSNNFLIIY